MNNRAFFDVIEGVTDVVGFLNLLFYDWHFSLEIEYHYSFIKTMIVNVLYIQFITVVRSYFIREQVSPTVSNYPNNRYF